MAGNIEHTMAHVKDSYYFEVPRNLVEGGKLWIPQPFGELSHGSHPTPISGFCISKFMVPGSSGRSALTFGVYPYCSAHCNR